MITPCNTTEDNVKFQKNLISKECNCPEYISLKPLQFDQLKMHPNFETTIISCQKCYRYQSVIKENLIPSDSILSRTCVQCHKKFAQNDQTTIRCDRCTQCPCGSFYTPLF